MSIIEKKTLKEKVKIKNYGSLSIYKRERSPFWWVSFYVSKSYINDKSGFYRQSSKLTNQRDAERKAKEIYKSFDFSNYDKRQQEYNLEKDIFIPFITSRERKKRFKDPSYECLKEKQRFEKWIKPIFESVDYRDVKIVNELIEELVVKMKDETDIKDVTITKYLSLISLMFRWAKDNNKIQILPIIPTLSNISDFRPSYEPKELKMNLERINDEYKKTEDSFFDEMSDYVNWVRSGGFRPGMSSLNVKKFQISFFKHHNYEENMMRVHLPKTKTKEHWIDIHPVFTFNIYPKLIKRNPEATAEDYLFFPKEKNRERLYERIRKNFVRFSRELNLYIKNGKPRPLYSIRSMNTQVARLKGESLDSIAERFNTSTPMLQKHYLNSGNEHYLKERHFDLYKDYYTVKNNKKSKLNEKDS